MKVCLLLFCKGRYFILIWKINGEIFFLSHHRIRGKRWNGEKKRGNQIPVASLFFLETFFLLTKTEFFDDRTVAFDVFVFEVIEQTATFTNEHTERTGCAIILVI